MAAQAQMVTIKAVSDWSAQMDVPLSNAIAATVDLTGRSGRQACGMAMVYMARSARAMTKQAPKRRKIRRDQHGEFVEYYVGREVKKFYKWMSQQSAAEREARYTQLRGMGLTDAQAARRATAPPWEAMVNIGKRGLAKRSWMWGIKGLRASEAAGSKEIPGITDLVEVVKADGAGYILTNRLGYITRAAPADVEEQAARKASNQIMAQAAKALERRFGVEVPRLAAQRAKRREKTMAQAWRDAA